MICINCFHSKTTVANSRSHKKESGTWRRRYCENCQTTFTTYERPRLDAHLRIANPDGEAEVFSLGRLCLSIAAAFQHDQQQQRTACLPLAETVEQALLREVRLPSKDDIAAITHATLQRYDPLAATQYAAQHSLLTSVRRRGRPSVK